MIPIKEEPRGFGQKYPLSLVSFVERRPGNNRSLEPLAFPSVAPNTLTALIVL